MRINLKTSRSHAARTRLRRAVATAAFATIAVTGFTATPAKADVTANGRSNVHTFTMCGNAPGNYMNHAVSATTTQNGNEEGVWVMYYFSMDGKQYSHTDRWFPVAKASDRQTVMTYGAVAMPDNFHGWVQTVARIAVQTRSGFAQVNDKNVEAISFKGNFAASTTRNDGWCYVY